MNSDNLLNEIGMIDDDIIYEADTFQQNNKISCIVRKMKWLYTAAAVFLILGAVAIFFKQSPDRGIHTDNIEYYRVANPKKISCTFASEGMGGENDFGHVIVKNYSEVASNNPTRNNIESITELPVFNNIDGLWSETYHDINSIDELIYFDQPGYEKTIEYSYNGSVGNSWNICYRLDSKKSIVNQLLDYSFYRIIYTKDNKNDTIGWAKVLTPSFEPGIVYPIISLDEAKEKLRKGNFFCFGSEKAVAKTAEILSVELVYRTDEYQTYIQPFYMFYITDSSWNIKEVMQCDNENEFTSVSPIFIPAVEDDYLEVVDPEVHFN